MSMRSFKEGTILTSYKEGFTLLEMLVSIAIFSVVIISSIGVLLSISAGQAKSSSAQVIQDNIRYTLELMTKELRQAGTYTPSSCNGSQCAVLTFVSASGANVTYCLSSGTVKRSTGSQSCATEGSPLTSDEVEITTLHFYVVGSQAGALDGQPRATIVLKGNSRTAKLAEQSSFSLQSTVTRRLRDF